MAVAKLFQHVAGGLRFGKKIAAGSPNIEPGLLVKLASGSLCVPAGASDTPFGFAYGLRYAPYRPTTKVFDVGEPMAVVNGVGQVYASAEFFNGGTLPSAGNTIYTAASGLMATSGTVKVGYCIRVEPRIDPSGGTGVTQNAALIQYSLLGV